MGTDVTSIPETSYIIAFLRSPEKAQSFANQIAECSKELNELWTCRAPSLYSTHTAKLVSTFAIKSGLLV